MRIPTTNASTAIASSKASNATPGQATPESGDFTSALALASHDAVPSVAPGGQRSGTGAESREKATHERGSKTGDPAPGPLVIQQSAPAAIVPISMALPGLAGQDGYSVTTAGSVEGRTQETLKAGLVGTASLSNNQDSAVRQATASQPDVKMAPDGGSKVESAESHAVTPAALPAAPLSQGAKPPTGQSHDAAAAPVSKTEGQPAQAPASTGAADADSPAAANLATAGGQAASAVTMPASVVLDKAVSPLQAAAKTGKPAGGAAKLEQGGRSMRTEGKEAAASAAPADMAHAQASRDASSQSQGNGGGQNAGSGNNAMTVVATGVHDSGMPAHGAASPQAVAGGETASVPSLSDGKGKEVAQPAPATAGATAADAAALPSINTARVLQSMQGSEMRVGMHSVEFGSVSISTSMTHQTLAAQISFEHADLGRALAAHLPSIEARLSNDYGVQARVDVRDGSMSATAGNGRGQGEERQGQGNVAASPLQGAGLRGAGQLTAMTAAAEELQGSGRVDIRI